MLKRLGRTVWGLVHPTARAQRGFTLIELSIVLVIIGLIVGGVLVGQDFMRVAGKSVQLVITHNAADCHQILTSLKNRFLQ